MSGYHKHCSNPKPKSGALLTTKPFCDCGRCTCQNCPDILELLAITVTDSTCKFNSKMKPTGNIPEQNNSSVPTQPQNLLDVLSQNKCCNCDVVAHAVRDDIPKNLGMSQRRNEIADFLETCDKRCKGNLSREASSTKPNVNKPDRSKDNKDIPNNEPCKRQEKCPPCGFKPP